MGSCFSERFGGKCSGIPERCEKCLSVCKEKTGKQFSLPAKDEWMSTTSLCIQGYYIYCDIKKNITSCVWSIVFVFLLKEYFRPYEISYSCWSTKYDLKKYQFLFLNKLKQYL